MRQVDYHSVDNFSAISEGMVYLTRDHNTTPQLSPQTFTLKAMWMICLESQKKSKEPICKKNNCYWILIQC